MSLEKINRISKKINKIIIEEKLEKIIEMTYSYKEINNNFFYNITLFEEFTWIKYDLDKAINFFSLKNILENKLNSNILNIWILILDLESETLDDKWKILYKSLLYIKKILEIVLIWIEFELEKAGYKITLTIEEQLNKISIIEEIEEQNFWLKIKNNLLEINLIHDYLFSLYINTKKNITTSEQIFFLKYINKLNNFFTNKNIVVNKINKKKEQFNFSKNIVSREKYMNIFSFIISDIYGLEQQVITTEASSIYDWEKILEIPKNDLYLTLSIKRILELIVHEIESHYINSFNNKILIWNYRWARNLEKEEWLAKVMEAFLSEDKIDRMVFKPTYMIKILYSELYSGDEFYKFIDIYNKMYEFRREPINEFLRQKRNYSLSLKGGQHKDISYWRWMMKVMDYLIWWWDFSLLFMWKVWFEDLDKLDSLYKKQKNKLIFPMFLWDIISLYLKFKEKWEKFDMNLDDIVIFLEKKYNFKWIERFNLKKNIWSKINKIKELLTMFDNLN